VSCSKAMKAPCKYASKSWR